MLTPRLTALDNLRLRVAAIALLALLPAALFALGQFSSLRTRALEEGRAQVDDHRDRLAHAYLGTLESTGQLLAAIAQMPGVATHAGESTSQILAALKREYPIYRNLFANRPDGSAFASAVPLSGPVDSGQQPWFRATAAADGFTIGDFIQGRITGDHVLTLAYPVRDAAGGLLTLVGAALPASWFAQAMVDLGLPVDALVLLCDDRQRVAQFGGTGELADAVDRLHRRLHDQLDREPAGGGIIAADVSHGEMAFAYRSLLDTASGRTVYLSVALPLDASLAAAGRSAFRLMIDYLVVALGLAVVLWFATGALVVAPVRKLLAATARITRGDYGVSCGIRGGAHELLELGRRFDAMSLALREREATLARYRQRLESDAQEAERRRSEAERHSQDTERRLNSILLRVQDVVFSMELDGTLRWVSPSVMDLVGYRPDEIIGSDVCACMAEPGDRQRLLRELEAGQGAVRNFEVSLRRKDGSRLCGSFNARFVHDADGRVSGIDGVVRDISELVEARERLLSFNRELEGRVRERTAELEYANGELEAFAYSVSHDLRAPLRSIEGFSQIVLTRFGESLPAQAVNYLERVTRASRHMAALIDDLLSLSRITRQELAREDVDLSCLAQEIIVDLHTSDPGRVVEVTIEPGLKANADARQCRVALQNLLENAWKYTGGTASAQIALRAAPASGGESVFCVTDNGVGFDMGHADRLFAPFQRLHDASEFEGTGIGLAIVQRVVQRHGGRVWAEAAPGQGARFCFSFGPAAAGGRA